MVTPEYHNYQFINDGTDLSPLDISVVWSPIYQYYENYHCPLLKSQHYQVQCTPDIVATFIVAIRI